MRNLTMHFELGELTGVVFQDGQASQPRTCVRGKTSGPCRSAGTFQWTSAVKALSLLAVKTRLNPQDALLRGEAHSLAASLDYAISKQPMWLNEMFGWDQKGISFCRRLILRTNPERKRPGPVTLGINQIYMTADAITIISDGKLCDEAALSRLCLQLEGLKPSYFQAASAA